MVIRKHSNTFYKPPFFAGVQRTYSETRLYKIRRESKNEFEIAEVYHNRGCLTRKF